MGGAVGKALESAEAVREMSAAELKELQKKVVSHVAKLEAEKAVLARRIAELEERSEKVEHEILPHGLEEFETIGSQVCAEAEALTRLSTDDAVVRWDEVRDTAEKFIKKLNTVIAQRLDRDDIVKMCDKAMLIGDRDFEDIYKTIWQRIMRRNELDLYLQEVQTIFSQTGIQQRSSDVVDLYQDAVRLRPRFIESLVNKSLRSADLEVIVPGLKKLTRICEKTLLRPDKPGSSDCIFDILRCMVVVSSMSSAGTALKALKADPELRIVRIKERFVSEPTRGGWRDCLLNAYFENDPKRHIFEVQIVHRELLVARKGLPGHAIYEIVRNASEILERLGVGSTKQRKHKIQMLKRHECCSTAGIYSAQYFRRIGVDLEDLVDAFSALELRLSGQFSALELNPYFNMHELISAGYSACELYTANIKEPGALLAADYSILEVFQAFEIFSQRDKERAALMHIFFSKQLDPNHLKNWGSTPLITPAWRGISLSACGHLTHLDLVDTQLKALPASIALLTFLERLDLEQNPHLKLPRELARLSKLQWLRLEPTAFIPGDFGATISAIGLDHRFENRQRVDLLFSFFYHVDLGHIHFNTKLSLGILWNKLTVAAVVGQANKLGIRSNWIGIGIDDFFLTQINSGHYTTFKHVLENKPAKSCIRIRFAGPPPWYFSQDDGSTLKPFDSQLSVRLETAFRNGSKRIRLPRYPFVPEENDTYEFDLGAMTQILPDAKKLPIFRAPPSLYKNHPLWASNDDDQHKFLHSSAEDDPQLPATELGLAEEDSEL